MEPLPLNDAQDREQTADAGVAREPRADPLSSIAVDANALAGAIGAGRGADLGRLIEDLLGERPAA